MAATPKTPAHATAKPPQPPLWWQNTSAHWRTAENHTKELSPPNSTTSPSISCQGEQRPGHSKPAVDTRFLHAQLQKRKNETQIGLFSAFFGWFAFYFAEIVGISTFLRIFMISCVCILFDLYFMSEMRSRSVSNKKEYCTKSVHVQILYIIRVIRTGVP